ncbi:alkaline-phosphatase-like protein [Schizophyllum amplum]|uniref:alkaline phosphatase n=1 Tax=Schizophyllum amplum TaxID=97359 RepID=A0A550C1L6_9AGAR|nr:alkaline-phosphatase-like protein [Auriculariopsis ampla]
MHTAQTEKTPSFIAQQQLGLDGYPLGRTTDILLGGGLCAYIPESEEDSCRTDERDLLNETMGLWNVVFTPDELSAADALPLLGLFATEDLAYAIDRPDSQPGLAAMVNKALELLTAATADSDKGFFLFFENEVTDKAQHANDIVGTVSAGLELSETAELVKEWVTALEERGDETLFLLTADHETGGLGLGTNAVSPIVEYTYGINPFVIANASHSSTYTTLLLYAATAEGNLTLDQVHQVVADNMALQYFSDDEATLIIEAANTGDVYSILAALNAAVNPRVQVGWTTMGHTAVDVDIYCSNNPYCSAFYGSHENAELLELMLGFYDDDDIDVGSVTEALVGFNATASVDGSAESEVSARAIQSERRRGFLESRARGAVRR